MHSLFSRPIKSGPFLAWGFGLALVKYAAEALLVFVATGHFYSPWAFALPFATLKSVIFAPAPEWLPAVMLTWSVPFLFVGLMLTVRRCLDVNLSPWSAFWMLCPIVNIVFLIVLGFTPSAPRKTSDELDMLVAPQASEESTLEALRAVFLGLLFGASTLIVAIYALGSYGTAIFMLTPILMSAITAHQFQSRTRRGLAMCFGLSMFCVTCAMLLLLLTAVEGLICVAMASPMIYGGGAIGTILGFAIAAAGSARNRSVLPAIVLMPVLAAMERAMLTPATVEVVSSVEINASCAQVWPRVVEFSPIEQPPEGWLACGIAYPVRARIEGKGVGATRYCEFSTGAFVEPITVWDQPKRLAFNVTSQPCPMTELSPYPHIHPPHLDGYLASKHGEFRLIELGEGRMRLEGHTWYSIDMYPQTYWQWWSTKIIHAIHLRVLEHIKREVEQMPVEGS